MPEALVAVNVDVGREDAVFDALFEMPEVKEVYMVYGNYDLFVLIEAPDMDSLREIVTGKIRKLEGVKSTHTMVIVRKKSKS